MLRTLLLTILVALVAIFAIIVMTMRNSAKHLQLEKEHPTVLEPLPGESAIEDYIKPDSINLLQRNLVGKNTFELNTYASHTCWEQGLEDSINGFSIAALALNINNCQTGKGKIVLEKLLFMKNNKAVSEITDELLIGSHWPDTCYTALSITLPNESVRNHYLICYRDDKKELLTTIHKLWLIDLRNSKLTSVNVPANFRCHNPDYLE